MQTIRNDYFKKYSQRRKVLNASQFGFECIRGTLQRMTMVDHINLNLKSIDGCSVLGFQESLSYNMALWSNT
jgi:hypothetical protein